MIVNPPILDPGLMISPAINGVTFWDINGDEKLVFPNSGEWFVTPTQDITVDVKMWGGGGASSPVNFVSAVRSYDVTITGAPIRRVGVGGSGGFSNAKIILRKGTTYVVRVGQGGSRTKTTDTGATYLAGGGQDATNGVVQGGGYSGIFKNSVSQANALIMAGGGGGAATMQNSTQNSADPMMFGYNNPTGLFGAFDFLGFVSGAGGGLSGQTSIQSSGNTIFGSAGGTQTAGGSPASSPLAGGATAGSALTGGLGVTSAGSCGGGGGYFGGGGGARGAGGGSGRIGTDSDVLTGYTLTGVHCIPPKYNDPDWRPMGGFGGHPNLVAGNTGRIVIQKFSEPVANTFYVEPPINNQNIITLTGGVKFNFPNFGEWEITPLSNFDISVKMWGAGGARGYQLDEPITSTNRQGDGGSGGYASGIIQLIRGERYIFRVGEGGFRTITIKGGSTYLNGGVGNRFGGTQGGGYTGIFRNYETQDGALLIAGGGGGGGDTSFTGGNIGGGGGISGQGAGTSTQGGGGGSQVAGGAAGGFNSPSAGSALRGGVGQTTVNNQASNGGGGGGYFGGGGGNVGGGGGGSGFTSTIVSSLSSASGNTPANSSDPDRSGAGQGGNSTIGNTGTDGRIVIILTTTIPSVTDTLNLNSNILQFIYAPAGDSPVGSQTDNLQLDSNIVNFSYTL